jgi:hypothetical protein
MKYRQVAQLLALKDLIGVPHPLRFSKGAGFESMERSEHQNPTLPQDGIKFVCLV